MRRCLIALSLLLALVAGVLPAGAVGVTAPVPATTVQLNPGPASFRSDNLDYVATLPIDSPGVGARVVQIGQQKRLYVTGVQSLTIYDVTNPGLPLVLGRLELPNWENEDVAVSADGKTVLISEFTGTYMHVIEVLDGPAGTLIPRPVGFHPSGNGHIVSCIDTACDWVYGSEGSIIDLRDKADPIHLGQGWADQLNLRSGHNVEVITPSTCTYPDGKPQCTGGIVSTDITPITFLDVTDPTAPQIVAQSERADHSKDGGTAYQHNNKLPLADQSAPRTLPEGTDMTTVDLQPGELLMGNGETNFSVDCNSGSGPFATYSAVNWEQGENMRLRDVLRPVSGEYANGDPAVNALGCSGHWFDWTTDDAGNYNVAAAWYEHGTRLLKVDATSGQIDQIGFYQPVVGSASAAYWIDNEYIYTVDYERGIDILRYDKSADPPTTAEIDASWLAKLGQTSTLAATERYLCKLAQDRTRR